MGSLIVGGICLALLIGLLIYQYQHQTWICETCHKRFKRGHGYPDLETMEGNLDAICIPCHKLLYEEYGPNLYNT